MGLEHVRKTYEDFGEEDPSFAVLSNRTRKGGKWDPEEFFATGRAEIEAAMADLERLEARPHGGAAMDFGCGVGRLTQALAEHFDQVTGVDISSSMLATAREHNRHGERVRYLQNTVPDLAQLDSGTFDFVYSNIALQHTPRDTAESYISEFFRLLRPGGTALFQVPDGPPHPRGSGRARLTAFWRGPVRRFSKRIRGKATVEIHYVPRPVVERLVADAGCRLVEAHDLANGRKRWGSFRYCVRKPDAA
jgi:SAM-dependent methyltransferase